MANPPFTACIIFLHENPDGIEMRVGLWDDNLTEGKPFPPSPIGILQSLDASTPSPIWRHLMGANRTIIKNKLNNLVDNKFPDTPA